MLNENVTRGDFVASLRFLADAFEGDALPVPSISTSVHLNIYGAKGRDAFLAARSVFPLASPVLGDYFVELHVGPGVALTFPKDTLCTKRTEPRDVEVYDIDPELLLPVIAREEQDRQDAADDMRRDAEADAHADAQALGYHDDDCRASIEHDAMLDEIAAHS